MRVACAQYAIRDGNPDANRECSVAAILDAARTGADLVILPELANSGCDFRSRDYALALAEEVGDPDAKHHSPTVQAWQEAAEETGIFVVGGVLERDRDVLYNTAAIVGPGS